MSKKAMRRSPTSRNERRKAIARKRGDEVLLDPLVLPYGAAHEKGKRAADL